MMISLQTYKGKLRALAANPKVHLYARAAAWFLSAFCLSAASLGNHCMPLALGLTLAATGWSSVLSALGGCLGFVLGIALVVVYDRKVVKKSNLGYTITAYAADALIQNMRKEGHNHG